MSKNFNRTEKSYPHYWNEEDKTAYEVLFAESKRIYPKIDDFIIDICVLAHINELKGYKVQATKEEVEAEMSKYNLDLTDKVIETPLDPNFNMQETLKYNLGNIIEDNKDANETKQTDGENSIISQ